MSRLRFGSTGGPARNRRLPSCSENINCYGEPTGAGLAASGRNAGCPGCGLGARADPRGIGACRRARRISTAMVSRPAPGWLRPGETPDVPVAVWEHGRTRAESALAVVLGEYQLLW